MVTTYTLPEDFPKIDSALKELLRGRWGWRSRGAVFGLCGCFSAPIIGSIVTVISWFSDPAWHGLSLHRAGTTLFVLTLPLLILGAHCLDLLDRDKVKLNEVEGERRR
jgi:hypothetical protein